LTTRTWRAKRRIGAAALVALIGSTLAFAAPAGADGHDALREGGDNRYETAAAIAEEIDCGGTATFVNGSSFPDGLVASQLYEEILLVERDSIPAATMAYIEDCGLEFAYVVGGEAVISSDVFEDLLNATEAGAMRIAGADRYATALAVAEYSFGDSCDVVLATGENYPDALAAAPLAYNVDAPMLLTSGSSLRADVKAYLADNMDTDWNCALGVPTVHIIGGTSAVPASIETEINTMGIDTNRISGANRYETAVAIAGVSGNDSCAVLINGNGFADALGAGPWASDYECSLMLVNADSIPAATAAWHVANCENLDGEIYVAGGEAVVSDAVHLGAIGAATCTPVEATATLSSTASNAVVALDNDCTTDWDLVRLTANAGSGVDGLAGNDWFVDVYEGATTEVVTLDYDNQYLEVTIDVDAEDGTTAAEVVEAWNNLAEAGDLYTASLGANGDDGVWSSSNCINTTQATDDMDDGGDPAVVYGNAIAYVDQVVTISFNQDVTQDDGVDIDDGTIDDVDTSAGDTWVVTMERVTDPEDLVVAGSTEVYYGACSADFPTICEYEWIDIG
jgi:putative cell wall-binding protein